MKFASLVLLLLPLLVQEKPWTPFDDTQNRRQPERTSSMDVGHYKISIRMDDRIPPPVVEGRCEIDFTLTASTGTAEFDAEDMTITSVIGADASKMAFTHSGAKLVIDLGRKAAAGERFRVEIIYTARPTTGLFFITPVPDQPKKPWQVWTQGETEYNHHWFPCYDYPNDRATSEVIISVREKYRTVSNGQLVKSEVVHGWRTEHWKMETPHAAYLTSVAAGEFDVVEEPEAANGKGVPVRYFVPKGWHSEEEIRHTFGRTPAMMKFFADRTGVPYPYPKYDQVVVEDFTWGGMENISATTLHPMTVVAKRSWADRDSDGLIAHELAHQWFGDLVTCRTWAHIWLNEGFATYMGALWQENIGGREALVADLEDGLGWYLRECATQYMRPTVCEHYTWPDDVFDSHVYPKGAWILHMLRTRLGDAAWWKGVNRYLAKHRAGVVTTDDFRAAMEEAAGQDLKAFFDQWVFSAGHPEFKVTAAWNEKANQLTLRVEQTQLARKLVWKDLSTQVPFFEVPVDVEIETKAGRKTHRIDVKGPTTTTVFQLDSEPEIIDFDRDGGILKTLEFERTPEQLAFQLERDDQPWHRWWAASRLAGSHAGVAALRKALQNDPSNRVRIAAAKALGATATAEARAALLEKPEPDARVRKAIIEALAGHAKDAGEELEKFFRLDDSPACRGAAAASLGKRGAPSDIFKELIRHRNDEVMMPGILTGMLGSGHPNTLKACLDATEREVHPWIRVRATECLAELLATRTDAAGLKRLIQLYDDANFRVRRAAIEKSGGLKDAAVADALERRLLKEPEKRLVKDIHEVLRKLRPEK